MALSTPKVLLVVRLDAFKKPLQHALNTVNLNSGGTLGTKASVP